MKNHTLPGDMIGYLMVNLVLLLVWIMLSSFITPIVSYGYDLAAIARAVVVGIGAIPIIATTIIGIHHIGMNFRGK